MNDLRSETNPISTTESHGTLTGTLLVRLIVPAFVLFGAVMKFLGGSPASLPQWMQRVVEGQATTEAQAELTFLWVIRGLICIEVVAAGLMLFVPRLSRIVAGTILTAFLFVLLAEFTFIIRTGHTVADALTGSCGCFGKALTVPLWVEFAINAVLLIGVILFRPSSRPLKATPKWALAALLVWLLVGVQVGMRMTFPAEEDRSWVRFNPMYWKGFTFDETALFEYAEYDFTFFDVGLPQTWILYRKGCPVCHNLFEEEYSSEIEGRVVVKVLVPEDPSLATDGLTVPDVICPHCQENSLKEGIEWQISTPIIIDFDENGVVQEVTDPRIADFGRSKDEI